MSHGKGRVGRCCKKAGGAQFKGTEGRPGGRKAALVGRGRWKVCVHMGGVRGAAHSAASSLDTLVAKLVMLPLEIEFDIAASTGATVVAAERASLTVARLRTLPPAAAPLAFESSDTWLCAVGVCAKE